MDLRHRVLRAPRFAHRRVRGAGANPARRPPPAGDPPPRWDGAIRRGAAAALWWAHFDPLATMAAQRLRGAPLREQVELARDAYPLLHLPLVGGIIIFAMGLRRTLLDVDARLDVVPAVALLGGVALYLLALTAVKWRSLGSIRLLRPLAAAGLLPILPAALAVPALAALGVVTAGAWLPIAGELVRQPDARRRARLEALSSHPVARDIAVDGAPRRL